MKTKTEICYPCNGRGYSVEATIEADGTIHREKIPCECCDGLGEIPTSFVVPPQITTKITKTWT